MKSFFEYSIENLPSTEEEIIYDLVDGILTNNDKINELKNSLEFNDENGLGLKINNLKQEFTNNVLKIQQNKKDLDEKEKIFQENKIKFNLIIENLNNDFNDIQKKLKNFYNNNFNVGEIFDLSFDKIEKILMKIKDESNLKNISIEFDKIENSKRKLSNNLNENLNKKNQIIEINKMLNEEKITIENNLFNLISEKESLEEIIKNYLNFCLNNNNNNNDKIKKLTENFEIFHYQISFINLINFSQNFSENFFDFIEKNNLFKNISYQKNINIKICKNELNTLLKNTLINFIKQKPKKNINEFFINLSKEILSKFNINFLNSKKFENFIKINIKLNYLIKIIESYLNFIKISFIQISKENEKKLLEIDLTINKLNLQQNEKQNKLNEIDEKKNSLINSNANNNSFLNQKEKEYLILSEKSLNILNKKKENEKELNEIILTFNLFKENIINKIDELNNKNISIQNEIEYLNSQNDINNLNIQKEIESIKNGIKNKYKMIKIQLTIFKRKHKNNLNIYQKLLDKINNSLNLNNNTLISGNFNNDSFSNNSTLINNSNFFENNNNNNNFNNSILNTNNLYSKNRKLSHRNMLRNNVLLQSVLSGSNSSISIFSPSKINNRYSMGKFNSNNINASNNFLTRSNSYKYFSPIKSSRNFFYNNSNNNSNNKQVNNILNINNNNNNNSNLNYNNSNVKNNNNNNNNLFFQINNTKNKTNSLSTSHKKYYNRFNVSNNMKDSTINSLNDKNSTINTLFYLKKQSTIHSLKYSPDNNNNIDINNIKDNNINEINILLESFPVYFRNINFDDNNNKFDPLNDLDYINNFGFLKGSIKLDNNKKYLLIFLEEILYNKINLNDIKSTILNNQIKYIIQIHQKYKQIVKNSGYIELEDFIKLKDLENIPFDDNNKIKALKNKIFNFSIIYNNNNGNNENNQLKIEFLFASYDNVKIWLNGLNYFIINNKKLSN